MLRNWMDYPFMTPPRMMVKPFDISPAFLGIAEIFFSLSFPHLLISVGEFTFVLGGKTLLLHRSSSSVPGYYPPGFLPPDRTVAKAANARCHCVTWSAGERHPECIPFSPLTHTLLHRILLAYNTPPLFIPTNLFNGKNGNRTHSTPTSPEGSGLHFSSV